MTDRHRIKRESLGKPPAPFLLATWISAADVAPRGGSRAGELSGRRIAALLLHYQNNKHQTTAPHQRLYLPPSGKGLEKQKPAGRGEKRNVQEYEDEREETK